MSAPVFLSDVSLHDVAVGDTHVLDGAEGRHAAVVQRLRVGELVDVVDGVGVRLHCRATVVYGSTLDCRVESVEWEPPPAVRITLVQALAKGDRDEMAVEAAVECGVDAITPWQAERSVVVWRGDRAARSKARWVNTVRAAVKQARRAYVPSVADAVTTKQLAERVRQIIAEAGAVLVLHESATMPISGVALPTPSSDSAITDAGADLLVVVGPEGGISDTELAALADAGAQVVRLGPHVMRTSTAGPVAIALLSERLGRWV